MAEETIKIMVIEDNPADVSLIRHNLDQVPGLSFQMESTDRLEQGLAQLKRMGAQILLLDLSLPDSQGLDTLLRARADAPDVAIVVLTGLDDESLAVRAVQEGAQDYLVKNRIESDLLVRSIRYAMVRNRIQQGIRQARKDFGTRKMKVTTEEPVEAFSDVVPKDLGKQTISTSQVSTLSRQFSGILDKAVAGRTEETRASMTTELKSLANELALLRAGAQDAIAIYETSLRLKASDRDPESGKTSDEFGPVMLLELLGHLASLYHPASRRA